MFALGASFCACAAMSARWIGYCDDICNVGVNDRLHAVAADPADAEESEPRSLLTE